MRIGIFAKTFAAKSALASLAAVKRAGFDCAQFNLSCLGLPTLPEAIGPEIAGEIVAASRATGVAIPAISGTYNLIDPDINARASGLRRLGGLIAAAPALGAGLVTLCTGTRDPHDMWRRHPDNQTPEAWAEARDELTKALRFAEAAGVDLGVEPELANIVDSAAAARRMADEVGSPRFRIVLDPANLVEVATPEKRREIVEWAIDLLADRIALAHAKDRDAAGGFVAAGRGVIDFRHFIRALRRAGFDGPLIAHGLAEAEAPGVAAYLREAIAS
jgi:sugar phosphate isomerase/epimerase